VLARDANLLIAIPEARRSRHRHRRPRTRQMTGGCCAIDRRHQIAS
jgi:hypothetical protein